MKRSKIGIIAEFRGIPNEFPNLDVIDRSGVSKKSLSRNSSQDLSVDTNATIAEHHNNVIELVHDGNNKLLRDVSSSATFSI